MSPPTPENPEELSSKRRRGYLIALWRRGQWGRALAGVWTLIGIFVFVRDDVLLPKDPDKWRTISLVSHLSFAAWASFFLFILLAAVYESGFHIQARLALKQEAVLEIIFEPMNPARRFWSLESHFDHYKRLIGTFWEHRVEIRNNSTVTLKGVSVFVEKTGPLPVKRHKAIFDRTMTETCDINPGCSEFVLVNRWAAEKRQAGMLAGNSAWGYGPIEVTETAENVPPTMRVFDFNYDTDQMLFERGKY